MLRSFLRRSMHTSLQSRQLIRAFSSSMRWNEHFLNVNTDGFEKAISKERATNKVVLVDFYAAWCNPCKEKLAEDTSVHSGSGRSIDLVTVDTDTEVELALQYSIRSLPTVIAFRDGEPISKFTGALPEEGVRKFLETL